MADIDDVVGAALGRLHHEGFAVTEAALQRVTTASTFVMTGTHQLMREGAPLAWILEFVQTAWDAEVRRNAADAVQAAERVMAAKLSPVQAGPVCRHCSLPLMRDHSVCFSDECVRARLEEATRKERRSGR